MIGGSVRSDGTPEPYTQAGGVAGEDFIVQPMVRQKSDSELVNDLKALEGRVYAAKLTQLVFNSSGELEPGKEGAIVSPTGDGGGSTADTYPEAVIAFAAEFHLLPNSSSGYITGAKFQVAQLDQPVFTRNLAVRR